MIKTVSKQNIFLRKKIFFPYEIAIPTTGNPVLLRDTTLNILKSYRIPFDKITIFLHTKKEESSYKDTLLSSTYGKLVTTYTSSNEDYYNYITDYYMPGTPIIYIKDCIKYIVELTPTRSLKTLSSFLLVLKTCFLECEKHGARLWGICPTVQSLSHTMTTRINYIPDVLWGCINPGNTLHLTQTYYEDYERSIKYYMKDNAVIRLNMITAIECVSQNTESEKYARKLQRNYPDYVTLKKTDPVEIQLHDIECKILE